MKSDENIKQELSLDEIYKRIFEKGWTLRDCKGITDIEMEAIYSLGFHFYQTGRLREAEKIFEFLVMFDHLTPKYFIGLGAVQQVKREFKKAVKSYSLASILDLTNPKPQYLAAECYLAMGDKVNALSALTSLDMYAPKDTVCGKDYRAKATALKARFGA